MHPSPGPATHMTYERLAQLRADVKRLHTLSTKKISRIKNTSQGGGAVVSGSSHDPRRSLSDVNSMSRSELLSYRRGLNSFLSRQNQFVGGARGAPIPRTKWANYKAAEQRFNGRMKDIFNRYKDIKLPSGETVAEEMAKKTPDGHKSSRKRPSVLSYNPIDRNVENIYQEKNLDRLIDLMNDRNDPLWDKERLETARDQMNQIADRIGEGSLKDEINALTDDQFFVLWNYTELPTDASIWYEIVKFKEDPGYHGQWFPIEGALTSARLEYIELVKWAATIKA